MVDTSNIEREGQETVDAARAAIARATEVLSAQAATVAEQAEEIRKLSEQLLSQPDLQGKLDGVASVLDGVQTELGNFVASLPS